MEQIPAPRRRGGILRDRRGMFLRARLLLNYPGIPNPGAGRSSPLIASAVARRFDQPVRVDRMDLLRIRLLGAVELSRGGVRLPAFPTQKSRCLFALLLLRRGRTCPRHVAMGSLWGDRSEAEARKALRTELWRMRGVLEPEGVAPGTYVRIQGDEIGFNWEAAYWLDVEELEVSIEAARSAAGAGSPAEAERHLAAGVGLYVGPLLDGHYEAWCLGEAERLRALYLRGLEMMVGVYRARQAWDLALRRGTELLRHDPLREHVHRDLMRCDYALGNRPGALRRYEEYRALLREELGIGPMRETRELHRRILEEAEPPQEADPPQPPGTVTAPPASDLRDVADELERLAARVRRGAGRSEARPYGGSSSRSRTEN